MAHIKEVIRNSEAEACSFLDAFYHSDSASAVGIWPKDEKNIAVSINWDSEEENGLDEQISLLVTDRLEAGNDLDEISASSRIFPNTIHYNPEWEID